MNGLNEMATRILAVVEERDWVTFAELSELVPGFCGDQYMALPEHPNTIVWIGISKDATEAIDQLLAKDLIVGISGSPLSYYVDGKVLTLPLAKSTKRDYKKPRWLPITFRPAARAA